jgi:alginate O-acetyltransferase complex protein AlgJ
MKFQRWMLGAMLANTIAVTGVQAADVPHGMLGKNEWLFYRHEITDASDAAKTNITMDLIQRFNKVLAANQIAMGVVMVPLKMRIYAEYLPDEFRMNDYMASNNERMTKALRSGGVHVLDIHTGFLNSAKRTSDTPLFFRLDQNWSPTGVLSAAETIKAAILDTPDLKKALDSTPEEEFKVVVGTRKRLSKARDLIQFLPSNTTSFVPEQVAPVTVTRAQPPKMDALGRRIWSGIALNGSGFSHDWTGFADALRYTLQRDVFSIGVGTDQGSWVGMESYLRSDAFQSKPPRMLIWEMPERDMRAPPDYKFRDARYQMDNTDWLLRVSALVQTECKPAGVTTKLANLGLAANAANWKGTEVSTGPVSDTDFLEVTMDRPLDKMEYLVLNAMNTGSRTMVLEGPGAGSATRRLALAVPGDDAVHAIKTPLTSLGAGLTRLRIIPGQSSGFSLKGIQVCRQPADLLQ